MNRAFVHLLSLCFTYEHTFLVLNLQGRKGSHNQAEGAESEARGHGQHDAKRYLAQLFSYSLQITPSVQIVVTVDFLSYV
jgi:hypothetical protein